MNKLNKRKRSPLEIAKSKNNRAVLILLEKKD
jgi:hypothetical protein